MSAPLTEPRYRTPLILITSLFFLWAFGVNLNDVLIPHLKKAFHLTDVQSSLIQFAFFGGYCLAALPAGWLMERIGYKRGILTGLAICAVGALLFLPAATLLVYTPFLLALFIMACGQSFLEVAANPYVTILGPTESAERRLNLSQSFNAVGAFVSPIIGQAFILTNTRYSDVPEQGMTAAQLAAMRAAEAGTVKGPYVVIAGLFLLVAALIYFARLPEPREHGETSDTDRPPIGGLWKYGHLTKGVIAQFLYVGAQVGVTSFVIRFSEYLVPKITDKTAAPYLTYHLAGFMLGRFGGSAVMKYVPAARLLVVFAAASFVLVSVGLASSGLIAIWAVVLIGFFHSIMFPTIFALAIKDLGVYTKLGSSFLVMSIVGGAALPVLMGYISDSSNIQRAFVVPLVCYLYILYYGLRGYRPTGVVNS